MDRLSEAYDTIDQLEAKIESLQPYLQHIYGCPRNRTPASICICDLDKHRDKEVKTKNSKLKDLIDCVSKYVNNEGDHETQEKALKLIAEYNNEL